MVKEKIEEKIAIQESESHKEETDKIDAKTQKAKRPKKEKPANPAFPHETTINAYGFLQFGKDVMEALGLTKSEKTPSGKACYPVTKVSITALMWRHAKSR